MPERESIVFIYDEKQINQLKDLLRHKHVKVVCISESLYHVLKNAGISFTEIEYYKNIKLTDDIHYESLLISEIWYKSLEKEFLVDGISIFECIERDMYNFIHPIIKYIDIIENVLKDENPKEVYVFGYDDLITNIIKDVCLANKVNIIYKRNNSIAVNYLFLKNIKPLVLYVIDIISCLKRKWFHIGYDKSLSKGVDIIQVGAYPMDFESIERKYSMCGVCTEDNPLSKRQWELEKKINAPCFFTIEKYLRIGDIITSLKYILKFNKISKSAGDLIKYEKYDLMRFILKNFIYYFTVQYRIMKGIEYLSASQRMIEQLNPRIILVYHDRTPAERVVVEVGKRHNIPAVTFQHGIHSRKGTSKMVTDIYAVYGESARKLLIEGGYDPNRVKVIGIPKYDLILNKIKTYNKGEICKKCGIDPRKKIILYISDPFPKSEYYLYLDGIRKAFDCIKEQIDSELIIKLHALEHVYQVKNVIKEQPDTKIFGFGDIDVWELLYICDIIIVVLSTTVIEGMILKKPVIILDPLDRYDDPYTKEEGIVVEVRDFSLLPGVVLDILTGKINLSEENRRRGLQSLAYKVDGKSTERLVELISSMILNKNT